MGSIILLPVVLTVVVLAVANTGPGQRLIEGQAASLSGGMVSLRGLSGRVPDALRVAHLEVRDAKGAWLMLDGVALDWSPLALLGKVARIGRLSADRVDVIRLPVESAPAKPAPPSKGGFSLPVRVDLRKLAVARLDVGAAVAGHAASLRTDGSGQFTSLDDAAVKLAIARLDGPGTYRLDGKLTAAAIVATLDAAEPSGGLVSGLAALPALGALDVHAAISGPRGAEKTDVSLAAGQLRAAAHGTVDLVRSAADLDVTASAPAMAPRPDVSWESVAVQAHVHGPFTSPDLTAHAALQGVHGGGAAIGSLTADAMGNRGTADVHAVLTGLVLPPPQPGLFAAAPVDLTLHADLGKPGVPVAFGLKHPLITADGTAVTAGDISARLHTVIPNLAPFAAIGHADIQGSTEAVATLARHGDASDVTVDGTANFTGGQAPLPTALGVTKFGATARLDGQDLTITRAIVDGRTAHASVTGTDIGGALALAWKVGLTDLAALTPQAVGSLEATGRVDGKPGGLAVQADLKGDVGTASVPRGPLTARIRAEGLPGAPSGTIDAQGRFAGAPVNLAAAVSRAADGTVHAVLTQAGWKSLDARADMTLAAGQRVPVGTLTARIARLGDLSVLTGQALAGSLTAKVSSAPAAGKPDAKIDVLASNLAVGANGVRRLAVSGHVADPAGDPVTALVLTADGVAASGITGQARVTASGPQDALVLRADSSLLVQGAPATLGTAARLDAKAKHVTVQSLAAAYKGETLRLRAPATVDFGGGLAVDRLSVALGAATGAQASLEAAGRISPKLALTASVRNVTPDLVRPFAPTLQAAGLLTADATLSGTTAAPQGSVRVQAGNLRLRSGPAASLPPGSVLATVVLAGTSARVDARVSAGPRLAFAAVGTAPLSAAGTLAMRVTGHTDLALLDPILGATGQRAAGNLALDASVGGTAAAPRLAGSATLDRGEIQDFVKGLHITDMTARLVAAGDSVELQSFSAKAAPGTLSAHGKIGIFEPGVPVDLHFAADNARPLASDLLTATLDASLAVKGQAAGIMDATGRVFVRRADINIPNSLPPSVATLHVRRPGDKPPPPPSASAALIRLALEVDAPNSIFVRGHGLDSELGGKLSVGGTSNAPDIGGGFQLRRGTFSIAGTTLNFSKGEVGFDGTGVTNKIDPTLNFVADSTSGSVTATLTVGGYADAPTIKLSSTPDLPQDEVLAHLLFGVSVKDLSAIQIAEIASALAELSGVAGGGGDPLGAVRKGLGLDRLSVGGGGGGSSTGATVEAGRYVARGVFVGAKQATSGGGTAAEVQVDITRRLKAKAQLATGGGSVQGSTPDNDQGSTVGLSYQFEY
jgi:translocation and assembly module TamB